MHWSTETQSWNQYPPPAAELSNNILATEIHWSCVCTFSTFQRTQSVAECCLIGNRCSDWQVMTMCPTVEESPSAHLYQTERIKNHTLRVNLKNSLKNLYDLDNNKSKTNNKKCIYQHFCFSYKCIKLRNGHLWV